MEPQNFQHLELQAATLPVPSEPSRDYYDVSVRGLSLRVTSKGRRTWYYAAKINGVKWRKKIGTFHPRTLNYRKAVEVAATFRSQADLARAGVARNPIEVRRSEREARKTEAAAAERRKTGADSFAAMCDTYLKEWAINEKTGKRKRTVNQDERMIERALKPAFAGKDARDITHSDVRAHFDELIRQGTEDEPNFFAHNRRMALLKTIYNRANEKGFFGKDVRILNPCDGIRKKPEKPRQRALNPTEIQTVWNALEARTETFKNWVRLNLLTAAREGEVRTMRWADLDIDSDAPTWTITETKTEQVYIVPLSKQAVKILRDLRDTKKDGAIYVLPSEDDGGQPLSSNNGRQIEALRKDTKIKFQFRDLRRTAATTMTSKCGVSNFIKERCLNHAPAGIEGTYDAHDYLPEKREAFDKLGDRIEYIIKGNAVSLINPVREVA